jgi:hypothetical protein
MALAQLGSKARRKFVDHRHLPIVDDGKVVGIVSRFGFKGIELDRLDEETGLSERI